MTIMPSDWNLRTPSGSEPIAEGDDCITQNVERTLYFLSRSMVWRGSLPNGTDTTSWGADPQRNGMYLLFASGTYPGMPVAATSAVLERFIADASRGFEKFTEMSSGAVYQRVITGSTTPPTWGPWTGGAASADPAQTTSAAGSNAQAWLLASKGGPIGVRGKGVVALRFDHNMKDFQEKILPLLRERGLPASQGHFVQEFTPSPAYTGDISTGYSWTTVQNNALQSGIEVWSHSWTHTDASGGGLVKEIIGSRDELERVMPQIAVQGWLQPGVTGTKYDGFTDRLSDPRAWDDSAAGRMIAAAYPVSSGGGGILNPLTGAPRHGLQHWTIEDETTLTNFNIYLRRAEQYGAGLIMMMHPRALSDGKITVALLTQFLDEIVRRRDAGTIEVLTVSGLACATGASDYRSDIFRDGDSWATNSWTRSGTTTSGTIRGTAVNLAAARTAAQVVAMGHLDYAVGGSREISVEVLSGDIDITYAHSGAGITYTTSFSGAGIKRMPVCLPRTPGGNITITFTARTNAQLVNPHFYAI